MSVNHGALLGRARKLVPRLGGELAGYKGQAGKVGVFGGCTEYTGAPYYAAIAALRCGADLSHVFTTRGAATVIKTYSPELIVHPYLYESEDLGGEAEARGDAELPERAVERVCEWLPKLSCLVVGPGLGRDPVALSTAERVMHKAMQMNVPLVVDADGLWVWNSPSFDPRPFAEKDQAVVLTPNAVECNRLRARYGTDLGGALGENIVVIEKGEHDQIRVGGGPATVVDTEGSPRRCGGQGDVLAGCVATFLSWGRKAVGTEGDPSWKTASAYAGARLTRSASKAAFAKRGRATLCTDLVEEIGPAFSALFD
ncbi:ATP-dependent (S)-NAD(P)H-hydrate dehydratase [Chloropicon primus]|uniref:ATP-dependent (S)-NAD(P)H-hydrate dehydratase n=2 Tax=Chloropicon primus TaxID=1764295 RepID=A0A5B8MK01_9CHLO|nr:ATP-dependent (S)-NAD(P)H-hydrate dehydratase [Chloropicon primus]UPQ99969.1 ATP-dependent (S)-NAD(P)H-hydrate dehydratase [Chloropicon primus]|eukprot:QDZ20757.1 ATP-dependent (S)-NAD(P)H-hydrate dehydratase [Chloropicon primus]